MLSQRATVGYRFCYTATEERGNLDANLIANSRFYYENERFRQFINTAKISDSSKDKFCRAFGMLLDYLAL